MAGVVFFLQIIANIYYARSSEGLLCLSSLLSRVGSDGAAVMGGWFRNR